MASSSSPSPAPANKNAMFTITVPPIACSFPWRIHPEWLKLKELSNAWLMDQRSSIMQAACKGETAASSCSPAGHTDSAFDLLAPFFFPDATFAYDRLAPIVKLMNWYYMLDIFTDDPSEMGAKQAHADRMLDRLVTVFSAASAAPLSPRPTVELEEAAAAEAEADHEAAIKWTPQEEQLVQCLADSAREWWEEMCLNMTPSLQARFSEIFTKYLEANRAQVPFRESRHVPDLQAYLALHDHSVGYYPLTVLTEYCLGIELDQEALTHPLLISLHRRICEHVVFVNDIISFGREYMQGDLFNVISVLCLSKVQLLQDAAGQLPEATSWQALLSPEMLQEGALEASDMIKEKDREIVRLMAEIRGSRVLMSKPGMEAYLIATASLVAGNAYWHVASARYGLCTSASADDVERLHQFCPDAYRAEGSAPDILTPRYHRLSCPVL